MYHIQIAGAGYTGSRIAAYFRSKNQKIWALTRSGNRNSEFETLGITPVIADLTKPETLEKIPPAHFIVICPAPGEKKDETAYREIYLKGIGNYLAAIRKNPKPNLIVYLSSTGVYSDRKGEWVDETTPPEPDAEKGRILLEAEEQVLNSGFPAVVFRLAGIYGPGRNRLAHHPQRTEKGTGRKPLPVPFSALDDTGDRWMNLIHVEDIVGAMPVIFNKGEAGKVYLGVDDEPVLESEFCKWLGHFKMDSRFRGNDKTVKGKRCLNQRLKALGYSFKYPTFREGYAAIQ